MVGFEMKPADELLKARGLETGGKVQKFVDSECIRLMASYTPRRNNVLINSVTTKTKIGSGNIIYDEPYDRYMYYGKKMVSESTGSSYAKKYEKKETTDIDLKYNEAPKRGSFWFERMKADRKESILKGAQAVANRGKV